MKKILLAMTILLSFSATAQSISKVKVSEVAVLAKTDEPSVSKAEFIEFGKLYQDYQRTNTDECRTAALTSYNKMVEKAGSIEKLREIVRSYLLPTCQENCDSAYNLCIYNCCHWGSCCWDNWCEIKRMGCYSGCMM